MIVQCLYQLLTTTSSVTALVAGRVYPVILPQDATLPCISYQVISSIPLYTLDGPTGFAKTRIQVDSWSDVYDDVVAINEAIRVFLDGYTGTSDNGTVIYNTLRDNVSDYYEKLSKLYRVQTDWVFLHSE